MSLRDISHRSLEAIAAALQSDETADHDSPLPCVEGVVALAADVRDLLFPGYRRARRTTELAGVRERTERLTRLQTRLRLEIGRALVHVQQTLRVHGEHVDTPCPMQVTEQFLNTLPGLQQVLRTDVQAAFDGDPAAKTSDEILLCYPGIEAVLMYRVAHELHRLQIPYLPRILAEWAHRETGIDIHPGATIGSRFFIDHGTGVVIGETCEIGDGVTLYQGVTLGAWSFPRDEQGNLIRGNKRHPTLEDDVTVYSNATILGGMTVVGQGSQIGSSVTLGRSIPPNTIVTIEKPVLRFREAA